MSVGGRSNGTDKQLGPITACRLIEAMIDAR